MNSSRGQRRCGSRGPGGRQGGQSIVEYTVIMTFGFFALLFTDDAFEVLLETLHDNYQGYSYAVSLSDLPQYDSLYQFGQTTPEFQAAEQELHGMVDTFENILGAGFPDLQDFEEIAGNIIPDSPADILQGVGSFF